MIRIGEDEVDHLETDIGHQMPDGTVIEHDEYLAARAGAMLFGGKVMQRTVYVCTWIPMPESLQPLLVYPA